MANVKPIRINLQGKDLRVCEFTGVATPVGFGYIVEPPADGKPARQTGYFATPEIAAVAAPHPTIRANTVAYFGIEKFKEPLCNEHLVQKLFPLKKRWLQHRLDTKGRLIEKPKKVKVKETKPRKAMELKRAKRMTPEAAQQLMSDMREEAVKFAEKAKRQPKKVDEDFVAVGPN